MLKAIVVPAQPQIVFGDLTPEATAMALQDQGGKLSVVTAEGGLFGTVAGRYSNGQVNVDVFTQGYSGEAVRVKRVGREDVKVPRACITLGLMVQPEVMREVGSNKALTGRGLADRFLFCEPTSQVGHRNSRSETIPDEVKASYDGHIKALVLTLEKHLKDQGEPITLTLSVEAQERFYDVMDTMEQQLAPEGDCREIRGWAGKHAGRIGRIASLLHMMANGADTTVISAETVDSAAQIGHYYMIHALRAYSQMQLDGDTQDAIYVQDRLRQHFSRDDVGERTITEREIQRLCRKFKTKDELVPALNRLEDNEWIFPIDVKRDGPGRPSNCYSVHPKLLRKAGAVAA